MGKTKIRRTNINLDTELVDAAAAALGTARITDTVHAALRAVIDRAGRERLTTRDFDDLTPDVLSQLRRRRRQTVQVHLADTSASGIAVIHYDEDYERIAAITGQEVRWLAPRGSLT